MSKLSISFNLKQLSYTFRNSLKSGIFPSDWKEANIVSEHKKNSKHVVNKQRLFLVMPICLENTCKARVSLNL